MILSTVVIVTLAVGVSGYYMVLSGFQAELHSRVQAAGEESQLLCLTLGTMSAGGGDPEKALLRQLGSGGLFQTYSLTVYRADGSELWRNSSGRRRLLPSAMEDAALRYRFSPGPEEDRFLETLQRLALGEKTYYVGLIRDVSEVFQRRDQNLKTYRMVLLISVLCGSLAITLVAAVLTGPIRKLSRSTRAIAGGQYSRRARVRTQDELGQLAEDFNRMADSLEAKIRELAEAAQRQRDFTASFAHELKTPLTSVIGYADTLRSRELPRQRQMEAADYIFSEGKRLEAMSLALLDLFALERQSPNLVPVQAQALARSVQESCRFLLEERQVHLEVSVEPGQLLGEPNLLKTLLYNLVDNSRKATDPGGTVELLGAPCPKGYLFQVRDHGRGIPPEALDRITEPFYMVDKSRARAQGGAGLGLALCQTIAQAHGARLHFESRVGEGTRVAFVLAEVQP